MRKYPQIRVFESFDAATATKLEEVQSVKYKGDKDFKLTELIDFLKPFARKDPKEEVAKAKDESSSSGDAGKNQDKTRESKKKKKGYLELTQ